MQSRLRVLSWNSRAKLSLSLSFYLVSQLYTLDLRISFYAFRVRSGVPSINFLIHILYSEHFASQVRHNSRHQWQ